MGNFIDKTKLTLNQLQIIKYKNWKNVILHKIVGLALDEEWMNKFWA
jgi:hypothetical protein